MSKVLAAIKEEIAAIRDDMLKNPDPRQAKLSALETMQAQYERTMFGGAEAVLRNVERAATQNGLISIGQIAQAVANRGGTRAKSSETRRILQAARDLITIHGKPIPNKELVLALRDQGIEVKGQSPANSLSAILSNSDDFVSGGRGGWSLSGSDNDTNPTPALAQLKAGAVLRAAE